MLQPLFFSLFSFDIPPLLFHRFIYMSHRWVFSIPFDCPLLIASLWWHHHRLRAHLHVSLDDQSNVYHRSIRQTEGPQLVSRLPFKIHDLTSVNGSSEGFFIILIYWSHLIFKMFLRWRCWIVRICLIWWSYKVQVSFLRVDIGRRHWL